MRINADFDQRVVIRPGDIAWQPSPMPGVERRMLDRIGAEVARATSIVRYAPQSRFARHVHGGGEEFLVLDGVFSDEHGDYPAGTYVRNPIGTAHSPHSAEGCTILVKLHQFAADDRAHFSLAPDDAAFVASPIAGVSIRPLHRHGSETVTLQRWQPGIDGVRHDCPAGSEIYVVQGSLEDGDGRYPAGSWLRHPPGWSGTFGSEDGCLLWIKTGHLLDVAAQEGPSLSPVG